MTGKRMTKEAYCVLCEVGCETNPEILRLRAENERLMDTIDSNVNKLAKKEAQALRLQRLLLLSEQQRGQQMDAVREIAEQRSRAEAENTRLKTALDEINDIAVDFHETGPHDPSTAWAMVNDIYRLSLMEEDSANET